MFAHIFPEHKSNLFVAVLCTQLIVTPEQDFPTHTLPCISLVCSLRCIWNQC